MTTDEEKSKLNKLLQSVEVPEVKLTERCTDLVREFHKRYDMEIEEEIIQEVKENPIQNATIENPYRVDPGLLEENERKLRELLAESKRVVNKVSEQNLNPTSEDPKRPWRTNTNKEKLVRIDGELKRHLEKSSGLIHPLGEDEMQNLVKECRDETRVAPPVGTNRLRDTVVAAKKNLPNFQYKEVDNTTATAIMPEAHGMEKKSSQPLEFVKVVIE